MLVLILFIGLISSIGNASQPEGLVLRPPFQKSGIKVIRNKNITFVDDEDFKKNKQEAQSDSKVVYKTKYKVKGRSLPSRSGSVISVLEKGEVVEPIKDSEDGKWKAVYIKKNELKVWLPISTLTKKKAKDYVSSDDSEDFSDEASSEE
jgi:hypothetical protein